MCKNDHTRIHQTCSTTTNNWLFLACLSIARFVEILSVCLDKQTVKLFNIRGYLSLNGCKLSRTFQFFWDILLLFRLPDIYRVLQEITSWHYCSASAQQCLLFSLPPLKGKLRMYCVNSFVFLFLRWLFTFLTQPWQIIYFLTQLAKFWIILKILVQF